jgi:glucose/arabinose dehydrogenase
MRLLAKLRKSLSKPGKGTKSRQLSPWDLGSLESRYMLAGDAAVVLEDFEEPIDVDPAAHTAPLISDSTIEDSPTGDIRPVTLVFVDARVEDLGAIKDDLFDRAEMILVDANEDGLKVISNTLARRADVRSLHLVGHGAEGSLQLGRQFITAESLRDQAALVSVWRNSLSESADILLYGCETGRGSLGTELLRTLSRLSGADVAASIDRSGALLQGGNWDLEKGMGSIEQSVVFSPAFQERYRHTLPITIRAAGATGQENMSLLIDGAVVQSWSNIGGNYNEAVYQSFTYNGASGISADRIRVAFTNDLFVAGSIDRNLRVDAIVVDGQTFQSEATSVFSTGTWTPGGIVPGFWESEFLHGNGYFQYGTNPGQGSLISISAAGSTGQEAMQLLIDGNVVQTWNNVGGNPNTRDFQTFTYQASSQVDPSRIRIAFTNDLFDPGNGIDRNLVVDRITVGNTVLETEAPTVFSTGAWNPVANAITPGFLETEQLSANGYFQYGVASGGSQIRIFASGSTGQEQMQLLIDGNVVQTWSNVSTALETYTYQASDQVNPRQVRVAFTNDLFVPGTDRNLNVDRIEIGGIPFETEAPSVFSTGTYGVDRIEIGYPQNETLHVNGYFQYDALGANPGVIRLDQSAISVNETAGTVTLTVLRTQASDGVVSVDYRTIADTAIAGTDYQSRQGTLIFERGQTSATVVVPIQDDSLVEGNETFAFTIDNVTGGASLSVPRTAIVTIVDDEVLLPNFANFSNTSSLRLNADAVRNGNELRLTPAELSKKGSAYFATAIPISSNTSFQTDFGFRVDGGQGTSGADGFTFIVQNSPAGLNAIAAEDGQTLGARGITNSLIIEFDSFQNAGDISDNHISVVLNGQTIPIVERSSAIDLNGGQNLHAWVDYNGLVDRLAVYLSNTNTKPATPVLTANVDLAGLVGNQAYVGFTGATGGAWNNHQILDWRMSLAVPTIVEPGPGVNLLKESIATGLNLPTSVDFSPDGRNLYIAEQSGIVYVVRDGQRQATPFIDIRNQVNGTRDRGLLDIAVHPDFANNPYVYLLFTYDPPEVYQNAAHPLAGPDRNGNRAGRLIRVTANAATNYTTAVAGSEVVLLGTNSTWNNFNGFVNSTTNFSEPPAGILPDGTNVRDFIATDSESHTIGSVEFAADGSLFVSIGDGTSYNQVDPRTVRVQDIDNLSGKILRIDPLTGQGLPSNPFYNGDAGANRSKVYQYGLRNPFRIAVDPATGKLFVGDVGWTRWEEINSAGPGANFGWPYYEGGSGNSLRTPGYEALPQAIAFYASGQVVQPSLLALSHSGDGINAIVLGAVYQGTTYPTEFRGDLFFNDLGQGIVRNVSFDATGNISSVTTFTTGATNVVQIVQGRDGNLYFVDIDDGTIGRWVFV